MDELGRSRLWERYMASHDSEIREQLITEYAQLVKQQSLDTVDVKATA